MLNISRESEVNIVNTLIDHDVISGTDLIKIKKANYSQFFNLAFWRNL